MWWLEVIRSVLMWFEIVWGVKDGLKMFTLITVVLGGSRWLVVILYIMELRNNICDYYNMFPRNICLIILLINVKFSFTCFYNR